MSSRTFLDRVHVRVLPRTYVEIGIYHGKSLEMALPGTRIVGIDPDFDIRARIDRSAKLFRCTSDHFFSAYDLSEELGSPVDLAFIDGMHLFEFALRDFINIERHAHSASLVLIDDCIPPTERAANRERIGSGAWCGDVWKLPLALREYRPDLDLTIFEASGTTIVRGLDPSSTVLTECYEELLERYTPLDYGYFKTLDHPTVPWHPEDPTALDRALPTSPFRHDDPDVLRRARSRQLPTLRMAKGIVKDRVVESKAIRRCLGVVSRIRP